MNKKQIAIFIALFFFGTAAVVPLFGHAGIIPKGGTPFEGSVGPVDIADITGVPTPAQNAPSPQEGAGGYTPIVSVPGLNAGGSLPDYLNALFKFAIIGGGILAIMYIIVGGFEYMVSGAREAKKDGKEHIQNAIIGLLLLLLSYLILFVINPDILRLDPFTSVSKLTPVQQSVGQRPSLSGVSSLQELRSIYNTSCTNPRSVSYAGQAYCTNLSLRIAALEGRQGGEVGEPSSRPGEPQQPNEASKPPSTPDKTTTVSHFPGSMNDPDFAPGKQKATAAIQACKAGGGTATVQNQCFAIAGSLRYVTCKPGDASWAPRIEVTCVK